MTAVEVLCLSCGTEHYVWLTCPDRSTMGDSMSKKDKGVNWGDFGDPASGDWPPRPAAPAQPRLRDRLAAAAINAIAKKRAK